MCFHPSQRSQQAVVGRMLRNIECLGEGMSCWLWAGMDTLDQASLIINYSIISKYQEDKAGSFETNGTGINQKRFFNNNNEICHSGVEE